MTDILKTYALKSTPTRVAVLELLSGMRKPVDVSRILTLIQQQGIETDRATVFRTVNIYTERGITRKVDLGDGRARYELASLPHHHHAVCVKCNTIIDITHCNVSDIEQKVADQLNFTVITHNVELYGTCASCS